MCTRFLWRKNSQYDSIFCVCVCVCVLILLLHTDSRTANANDGGKGEDTVFCLFDLRLMDGWYTHTVALLSDVFFLGFSWDWLSVHYIAAWLCHSASEDNGEGGVVKDWQTGSTYWLLTGSIVSKKREKVEERKGTMQVGRRREDSNKKTGRSSKRRTGCYTAPFSLSLCLSHTS